MSDLINEYILFTHEEIKDINGSVIKLEYAFSLLLLKYRFDINYSDQIGLGRLYPMMGFFAGKDLMKII